MRTISVCTCPVHGSLAGVIRVSKILQFFQRMGSLEGPQFELLYVLACEDAVFGYYEASRSSEGKVLTKWNRMNLCRVRNGRIFEAHLHESDQYLVDALYRH